MYHLTVQNGAARGAAWEISDGLLLLGRSRDCPIHISNDSAVSRVHCELRVEGREVSLKHLSERSVTLVNGKVVNEARLQPGDTVTVGLTTLLLARSTAGDESEGVAPGLLATRTIGEADAIFLGGGSQQALAARVDSLRDLAELFRLSTAFNQAETPEKLLETLSESLHERFAPAMAWIARSETEVPVPLPGFDSDGPDAFLREALRQTVASGQGVLMPRSTPAPRVSANQAPEILMLSPMNAGGRVLGALALEGKPDNAIYSEDDLQFFVALTRAAAPCLSAVEQIVGLRKEVSRLRSGADPIPELLGESAMMEHIRTQLRLSAQSRLSILILGESGTGKELAARMTHTYAAFNDGPYVVVNCAAIPAEMLESELFGYRAGSFTGAAGSRQGLIARANGGTLFLDEVGDLSLENQARVLRVLETGVYRQLGSDEESRSSFRVVSATNKDIPAMVAGGNFRADLYHRLNGFEITLPPLREHTEDIPLLADHLFRRALDHARCPLKGISEEALAHMKAEAWPGNVRQLRNVIERGVAMAQGEFVSLGDLALPGAGSVTPIDAGCTLSLIEAEKRHIEAVYLHCKGEANEAARILGVSRSTFYHKVKRHGIAVSEALQRD